MGYTHYIETPKAQISKKAFNKIKADVKVIEDYLTKNKVNGEFVTLYDGAGKTKGVQYNDNYLAFNGKGDEGHETFYIDLDELKEYGYIFCKTNRNPYDIAVSMVLLSIKRHSASTVLVRSDGDLEDQEWIDAIELFNKIFPDYQAEYTFVKQHLISSK